MIALDTNILIYACDKADLKRQQVAIDLVSNARDGVLLWPVACEFVAASRKLRSQGFTMVDAWERLRITWPCFRSSCRQPQRLNGLAFSTQRTDGHSGTR
jgi:predicted nucleic acid-binding protein